jgi:molecular chaperone HtpG
MRSKKIMEINPKHKIIRKLRELASSEGGPDKSFKDLALLLYESSLLISGFSLDDPKAFTSRINRMIELGLSLEDDVQESCETQNTSTTSATTTQMEAVD